jgi:hypothetical protein
MKGEFKIEGTTLIGYHGPGGNVIIPDNVTTIGSGAFDGCPCKDDILKKLKEKMK